MMYMSTTLQATGASHLPQLLAPPGTSADIDEEGDHGILGLDINQLEDEEWLQAAGRGLQSALHTPPAITHWCQQLGRWA